jgi:hypothetical protein
VVELENFKLDDIAWRRQDIFRRPRLLEDLEVWHRGTSTE